MQVSHLLLLCLLAWSYTLISAQQVCVVDLGFIVDASGSIRDTNVPRDAPDNSPRDNWQIVRNFINNIIRGLTIGPDDTKVGMVTFSNRGRVRWDFNEYTRERDLLRAVDDLPYDGSRTNTTGGLAEANEYLFQPGAGDRRFANNLAIMITDGNPTTDVPGFTEWTARLGSYARQMRERDNIRIIGIGVTEAVTVDTFRLIVSDPFDDHYFSVDDFDQLSTILDDIITEACRTLAPPPTPPSTVPAPTECSEESDIMFVLDASGSIKQKNFEIVRQFVMTVADQLNIDEGRHMMGLMTFADSVNVEFELDEYNRRSDITAHIASVAYTRGRTNTAAALRTLRERSFRRGRDNQPDIAVILTDGNSNEEEETIREAFLAKQAGIHIIVIAVGDWLRQDELDTIASYPAEVNSIRVDDFEDLQDRMRDIRDLICNNDDGCDSRNPCRGRCVDSIGITWCECDQGNVGLNCDQRCREPMDVAFAVDMSGSIRLENFRKQMSFVEEIVRRLNIGQQDVSLTTFGNEGEVRFPLNQYDNKQAVINAIDTIYYKGGTTNTADALEKLRTNVFNSREGDNDDRRNVAIVLTDGKSNDAEETWSQARQLRGVEDTFVIAVGVGANAREKELQMIATAPASGNVYSVESFDDLEDIMDDILGAVCNQVNECDRDPCENRGACIDLIGGYRCECTSDFTGRNCEIGDSGLVDMAFIFDSSGSIRRHRFDNMVEYFASAVENNLEVRPDKTRVAAMRWSSDAEVDFYLNAYDNAQDVAGALRRMQYMKDRTHTAAALNMMRDNIFSSRNGDREEARNVAFVITDGNSNINQQQTIDAAIQAKIEGAQIIVLAVGENLNLVELRGIASQPVENNLFTVNSWTDVEDIMDDVISAHYNLEDNCRRNRCDNGECTDEIGYYTCTCRRDYVGRDCDRRCSRQMDLGLILDLSGSIELAYDIAVRLAEELIYGLPVELDRANIGLISYRDEATINFYMDQYDTKRELLTALAFYQTGGQTNTQAALRMLYRELFTSSRGDRRSVDNKAILITDGRSNVQASNTVREAEAAKDRDIELYVIAIGDDPDMGEVNRIASDPDSEHVFRVRSPQDVEAAARDILDDLCA